MKTSKVIIFILPGNRSARLLGEAAVIRPSNQTVRPR